MTRSSIIRYNTNQEAFICGNCGICVAPPQSGTENRNHCSHCLWSRHVDLRVGDRMSVCRGLMEPIALWIKEKKEWAIVHRCTRCGFIRTNRIAPDDSVPELLKLARRPYENLPFRIEAGEPLPAAGSCGKKEAI